ncbi:MAG: HAD family hydrolase [Elusimicrobia bacterium]|nr:HAD family hydrolase [Elusimicrobiota bacterium]
MRSILFDFGGTLDADGAPWIDRFFSLYRDEGVRPRREGFEEAFYSSDDSLAKRFKLSGLDLSATLTLQAQCVLETIGPGPAASRDDIKGRVVSRFLADCRRHFRRNRPILERLRRRYRLAVVSNFYGNLDSVLDGEGMLDLFDAIADSGVVGSEKPGAAIFLHAARGLGVAPDDCLMVGDSVRRDMRGAEGLGMPHALIAGSAAAACCPSGWVLADITELESRLAAAEEGHAPS